ncbi:MAG: superoxide dismutase [Candidatus Vogelbacteria bacterium]|nr:superoxide dismutase [Candidatus Vogelbacteria bacterium]
MIMHTLPALPYSYDALEPYIDEQTMRLHHTKHHQGYVDKLNAALEQYPDLAKKPVEELLRHLNAVPEAIRTAVRNHGGGHWNHTFFWQVLGQGLTLGEKDRTLKLILEKNFESVEKFQTQFKEAALGRFGSGWVWLVKKRDGALAITSTANQDTPFDQGAPILGLDVWEHAYYLKYQNRRADYIEAFFEVINWQAVDRQMTHVVV